VSKKNGVKASGRALFGWTLTAALGAGTVSCAVETGELLEGEFGGDESALETRTQAFKGVMTFAADSGCSATERTVINSAATEALSTLTSPLMVACMANHGLSADSGDSAEVILQHMRENLSTRAFCADLVGSLAEAPLDITYEKITFDRDFLEASSVDSIAAVILHEVAHNKGYIHGGIASNEFGHTVPEQLRACSWSISNADYEIFRGVAGPSLDVPVANGAFTGHLPVANLLSPVGRPEGTPYDDACPTGTFAAGLSVDVSTGITKMGFACRNSDGTGAITYTTERGVDGQSSFTDLCADGELLVGIQGKAQGRVGQVRGECLSANLIRNINSADAGPTLPTRGTDGGPDYFRRCAGGQAVRGIKTYADSSFVRSFTIACEDTDETRSQTVTTLPTVGSLSGQKYRDRCARGTAMSGIFGRSGAGVDRLGGTCVETPDRGSYVEATWPAGMVPGRGGWGGTDWSGEECPSGQALVGLTLRASARVDAVRGVCANAVDWSTDGAGAPLTYLDSHGGSSGGVMERMCPRAFFLAGWDVWIDQHNGTDRVFGLRPLCIKPEQ